MVDGGSNFQAHAEHVLFSGWIEVLHRSVAGVIFPVDFLFSGEYCTMKFLLLLTVLVGASFAASPPKLPTTFSANVSEQNVYKLLVVA